MSNSALFDAGLALPTHGTKGLSSTHSVNTGSLPDPPLADPLRPEASSWGRRGSHHIPFADAEDIRAAAVTLGSLAQHVTDAARRLKTSMALVGLSNYSRVK